MNQFELLAQKLGNPNLLSANNSTFNSACRQAISYYLNLKGYSSTYIAKLQGKERSTVIKQIKMFKNLLSMKDKLAIELWNKLNDI